MTTWTPSAAAPAICAAGLISHDRTTGNTRSRPSGSKRARSRTRSRFEPTSAAGDGDRRYGDLLSHGSHRTLGAAHNLPPIPTARVLAVELEASRRDRTDTSPTLPPPRLPVPTDVRQGLNLSAIRVLTAEDRRLLGLRLDLGARASDRDRMLAIAAIVGSRRETRSSTLPGIVVRMLPRTRPRRELVDPKLDVPVLDACQRDLTEEREDLGPDVDLVAGEGAGPRRLSL